MTGFREEREVLAGYCPPRRLCGMAAATAKRAPSGGSGMHIDPKDCHPSMDYSEHSKTYKLFLKLTAYTILGVVALMALLALFVV
jgi:hypothetical protein